MTGRKGTGAAGGQLVGLLEAERSRLVEELGEVRTTLRGLQAAQTRLGEQLATANAECERLAVEYVKTARQTSDLANLYVASLQLRACSGPEDVLLAMQEIVVGLIGCEQFGIFEVAPTGDRLERSWQLGLDERRPSALPLGLGVIGRAASSGEAFFAGNTAGFEPAATEAGLSACVPLRVGERTIGVLALFGLLPHKAGIDGSDRELLDLLACHGASALDCARRHTAPGSAC